MKKIVLVCGLISSIILCTLIVVATAVCYKKDDFEGSMVIGYAAMLLAFSLIYVGIRNYRDKHNNGFISFGKAFKIGFFITLIASSVYVLVWMIDYHFFVPDFMDKYSAHVIAKAKAAGTPDAEFTKQVAEMQNMKEMYRNPVYRILFTYLEVLPIGLIVSLICALILKKRNKVIL